MSRRGRAVRGEIDISSGLLTWKNCASVAEIGWVRRALAPKLGGTITLHDYYENGWLRVGHVDHPRAPWARAIAYARKLRGLNGQQIEMPLGYRVNRGILWGPNREGVYAYHNGRTSQLLWCSSDDDIHALCNHEEFEPIDDTPAELCRIRNKQAREQAITAYRANL